MHLDGCKTHLLIMKLPKRASAAHVVPASHDFVQPHFNQPDAEDRLAASFLDNWLTDFEEGRSVDEMSAAVKKPSVASIRKVHSALALWLSAVRVCFQRRDAADRLASVEVFIQRRMDRQAAEERRGVCA